jgi:hypothetical protein
VVVPLSDAGELCIYTRAAADFVVDVNGYVPAGSPLGLFSPARYLDTRPAAGPTGGAMVAAEGHIRVQVADVGGVPADAAAAVVNVTAVTPSEHGYATVYPCTGDPTAGSSLNYVPGQVVPNGAIVRLSDAGELCVFTKAAAHLLVDVAGFVPAGAEGLDTIAPSRLFDSREGARLGPAGMVEIQVTGRAGVPAGADAALLNVAVIEPDDAGYITLWPCGARPRTSNLNHAPGTLVRANNALTQLSPDGTVCAFSRAGADLVVDVNGWLDPPA